MTVAKMFDIKRFFFELAQTLRLHNLDFTSWLWMEGEIDRLFSIAKV